MMRTTLKRALIMLTKYKSSSVNSTLFLSKNPSTIQANAQTNSNQSAASSKPRDEATLKAQFMAKHKQRLQQDNLQCLPSFFQKTNITNTMTLKQIINHAQQYDNRSRQVCVELNWMTRAGTLIEYDVLLIIVKSFFPEPRPVIKPEIKAHIENMSLTLSSFGAR